MSDGLVELRVEDVTPTEVRCRVVRGGLVSERSGLNLPGVKVSAPSLTEKDIQDLRYGIERGVDFIAVSFVRRADDVLAAKRLVQALGADVPVIAKLEKPEAIANLDEILEAADGVMVARGDLGVEVSVEKVPLLQKMIIARAQPARHPGDHRHPDARVDGPQPDADPGRGVGRRQRHPRRDRRRDALGRDGDRRRSEQRGGDDEPDRRGRRVGARRLPDRGEARLAAGQLPPRHRRGRRRRHPENTGRGDHRLHPNRRHRAADLEIPPARCRSSR